MKAIIISVLVIILAAVLFFGNMKWTKKHSSSSPNQLNYLIETNNKTETEANFQDDFRAEEYVRFASAWPEDAKEQLEATLENKQTYHIVLLGSEAIGNDKLGLLPNIKRTLSTVYKNYVTIESIVYDGTSTEYVNDNKVTDLIKKKPDMVIFEPFTLNDNNVIDMDTSLANISKIIESTNKKLSDTTFILQPPNQIYNASLYPLQVDALQKYAERHGIYYLNHLENWPAGNDKQVLEFLHADGMVNEKGYKIWSDYINSFLVTE
ncbi:SGNH/GDSL hydrolase family protein [Niallia sp. 01092]|uniref:SGNH/GDSL hydrolase family protein n=1 Tax=unclassified Niallia TaxID=2837522 RepID=UPI003FD5B2B4